MKVLLTNVQCSYLYTIQVADTLEYIYADNNTYLSKGTFRQFRSVFASLNTTDLFSVPYYLLWNIKPSNNGNFGSGATTIVSYRFNSYLKQMLPTTAPSGNPSPMSCDRNTNTGMGQTVFSLIGYL